MCVCFHCNILKRSPSTNGPTCEVAGVAGRKADALNAGHVVHVAQQVGKSPHAPPAAIACHAWQVAAIGINILTQQGDLHAEYVCILSCVLCVLGVCKHL